MKRVDSALAWLDNRTGYKKLLHESLYENVLLWQGQRYPPLASM